MSLDELVDKKVGLGYWGEGSKLPRDSTLCDEVFCIFDAVNSATVDTIVTSFEQCSEVVNDRSTYPSSASTMQQVTISKSHILVLKSHKANHDGIVTPFRLDIHMPEVNVYITAAASWSSDVIRSILLQSYPTRTFRFYVLKSDASVNGQRFLLPPLKGEPPHVLVISSVDEGIWGDDKSEQLCHYDLKNYTLNDDAVDDSNMARGDNLLAWRDHCQQYIRESIEEVKPMNVIFINGEAVDIRNVSSYLGYPGSFVDTKYEVDTQRRRNYLILNAFKNNEVYKQNRGKKSIDIQYLPNAATSFAGIPSYQVSDMQLTFAPDDEAVYSALSAKSLVTNRGHDWAVNRFGEKSSEVAYLYFRCDRPAREKMFNMLRKENLSVIALGACSGDGNLRKTTQDEMSSFLEGRFSANFISEAVELYKPFKFVIAFENTVSEGYITEKLTNAFLANSVPIYYGAPDVGDYFNNKSFINCHDFNSLSDCASFVRQVNSNDELYLSYLGAKPMLNMAKWCEFFQWQAMVKGDVGCKKHFETIGLESDIARSVKKTFSL